MAGRHPIRRSRATSVRSPGLVVEAWPVQHSLVAPAVGYRLIAGSSRVFYVPDVADLPDPVTALRDVDLYVGDGATLDRTLVRQRGAVRIGHAAVGTQLAWCAAAGVRQAVFTHCGSAIVRTDAREMAATLTAMAREHGVRARIAYDGLNVAVAGSERASRPR